MNIGIDASRCRSGGAIAHLVGLVSSFDSSQSSMNKIHLWAHDSLLAKVPESEFLIKHCPRYLKLGIVFQLYWQSMVLKKILIKNKCDVLFSVDASSLCKFSPNVVLSQDLLSYEPGVMQSYRWGLARLRLEVIKRVQNSAFRRAIGVIFLTQYARDLVQSSCGQLLNTTLVPHGIDEAFRVMAPKQESKLQAEDQPIRCVYVSNTDLYKHQWNVVKAVKLLRDQGLSITLTLIGGGEGVARYLLDRTIDECDGTGWITQLDFLPHSELPTRLDQADIFVFASSCENLPITLLEGMAKGLPIACSNRGPMPEVLGDGGEYFDPLNFESIADAIHRLIASPARRLSFAKVAQERANAYTWEACSRDTFRFIRDSYFQSVEKQ